MLLAGAGYLGKGAPRSEWTRVYLSYISLHECKFKVSRVLIQSHRPLIHITLHGQLSMDTLLCMTN